MDRDIRDRNRRLLTEYISRNAERLQFVPVPRPRKSRHGFSLDSDPGTLKGIYYYRLRRSDELGYETDDLFVVLHQSRPLPLLPNSPDRTTFHAVGGAVLVFATDGSVRYAITKGLCDPERAASMREAHSSMLALGLTTNDTRFRNLPALSFAAMHRAY